MTRRVMRHYTEEELLMHLLGEETREIGSMISAHLPECSECEAVFQEFQELKQSIQAWIIKDLPEESWEAHKAQLMELFRRDASSMRRKRIFRFPFRALQSVWDYALEHPITAIVYVAAAVAFASERAIEVFRLQSALPAANQVIEILKQVL